MTAQLLHQAPRIVAGDGAQPWPEPYASATYGRAVAADGQWLAIVADGWRLPLVVAGPPEARTAASPYGYGGLHVERGMPDERAAALWRASLRLLAELGVVSVFLRFPPFAPLQAARAARLPGLDVRHASDTVLVAVQDEAAMLAAMTGSSRNKVRRALRDLDATIHPFDPDGVPARAFRRLYDSTMERLDAPAHLRFDDHAYRLLSEGLEDRLLVSLVRDGGHPVAASLFIDDGELLHLHLSGSAPPGTHHGANNLAVFAGLLEARRRRRRAVHLGGGTRPGDSLFAYKAAFGGLPVPFHVGRAVIDHERYALLTARRAAQLGCSTEALERSGYFPAFAASPGGADA